MPPTNEPVSVAPVMQAPVHPEHPPHRPWIIGVAALVVVLAGAAGLYLWKTGSASQAGRAEPYVIGIVDFAQQTDALIAFKERMEELGYTEGKDVVYVHGRVIPGPTMFEDMEREIRAMLADGVDLFWLSLELQAKVAVDVTKELGDDTPIVFLSRFHDPVEYGLVASYRSSGNNVTGVASNLFEVIQKNLEFFKQINPNMAKLGVFTDGFYVPPLGDRYLTELKTQAPRFGIEVVEFKANVAPPEAENAFHALAATIQRGDVDGFFHLAGHHYERQEHAESELAIKIGVPMAAPFEDLPLGGQFSYSDAYGPSGAQSALMVDKILKGARPTDIPVEFGARTELWLITHRAAAAGTVFPDSMIFQAAQTFDSDEEIPRLF